MTRLTANPFRSKYAAFQRVRQRLRDKCFRFRRDCPNLFCAAKQMDAHVKKPLCAVILLIQFLVGCSSFTWNNSPSRNLISGGSVVGDRYFGMHVGFVNPGTPWPVVPFGTWRLWDANVTWKDLEPRKGTWDFSLLDALIGLAKEHKVDVILPLALTPQWASKRPNEPSSYTPGAAAPPADIRDWIDYVRAIAARYKGKIAYYEIWNEVNFSVTWTGTAEEIVSLQQAAFTAIKSIDPDAQVISANLAASSGIPRLRQLLELGYANSADIIGYHFYVSPGPPEAIAPLVSKVSSLLSLYGVQKPIWNTETGWLHPSTFASEDQAAAFAVRALLVGRSFGIERFLWYEWDNHCCVSLFMTESDNRTPTRAALAYANLQQWLIGNALSPCEASVDETWSCRLQFADGRHGLILWNPKRKAAVNMHLSWTPTEVEDMYGNSTPAIGALRVGQEPVMLCE